MESVKNSASLHNFSASLKPRGDTPDFKWHGWSKEFTGFEIFHFGIFFLAFKTNVSIFRFVSFYAFWKFLLWLGNSAWDLWGLNFGPGIFWGLDFCPYSIIRVTWNPDYPPPPATQNGLETKISRTFLDFLHSGHEFFVISGHGT